MRKLRIVTVAALVLAMAFSTTALAAPSPMAGTVMVVVPGGNGTPASAKVSMPTQKQLEALASFISKDAAAAGLVPSVKSTIDISAPADYKGGDTPVVFAVAGLRNGANNVFAYILLPNGKTVVVPCTVRNGYVGFFAPAFGTVSIVELNVPGSIPSTALPATLH